MGELAAKIVGAVIVLGLIIGAFVLPGSIGPNVQSAGDKVNTEIKSGFGLP